MGCGLGRMWPSNQAQRDTIEFELAKRLSASLTLLGTTGLHSMGSSDGA